MGKLQRAKKSVASSSQYGHGRGRRRAPSLAVSMVALFISLGGVGYAAATIGSAQIKNNSVRSKDIRNNDIRGKDIRAGTLGSSDVKDNALTGADVLSSSLGKVPRAAVADRADTAGNANTVGGVGVGALQGRVRWVQVDGDNGSILAQSGGITVSRPSEGLYLVDFGTSTANAMISASGAQLGLNSTAFVNAQRCGGPPTGITCGPGTTANQVGVHGDKPTEAGLDDADFYLALIP